MATRSLVRRTLGALAPVAAAVAVIAGVLIAVPQTRRAIQDRVSVRGALALLGLRAETSGSGRPMSLALDRLEDHYRALDQRRAAEQTAGSSAPGADSVQSQLPGPSTTVSHASAESVGAVADAPAIREPARAVVEPNVPSSASTRQGAGDWPAFRGANRDGRYSGPPVLTEWPAAGLRELWRTPIGGGYASMTAAAGRLFTIEQRRGQEVTAAYDVETGREFWANAWDAAFSEAMGGDGPRATPTYSDGHLFALGAEGELRALDAASGRMLWRVNILEENGAENLQWGMAASPLVVGDVVVVTPGGGRGQSVVAYDRLTGKRRWSSLDDQPAYVAPMDVTIDGVRQLLFVTATRALGLAIDGSAVLWSFPWATEFGINSAQPIVFDERRVFLSAGYGHGAAVIDVSRKGESFVVTPVWQNTRMKNKFTSSVLHDGHFYGLDEAILACVEAATGTLKWKGGRYGYGQLILVGDQLWVTTEEGEVVQVAASPSGHRELGRFKALDGKTWNHPILSGGRFFVRNQTELAAYDVRTSTGTSSQP